MMVTKNDDEVRIKQRTILWYLVFIGFSVNYMIRININIAIVDMIDANHRKVTNNTIIASECIEQKENYTSEFFTNTTRETVNQSRHSSLERMLLDALGIDYERNGFKWDEQKMGLALGAFFWLHFLLQLPGGILSAKYGTKMIFGYSNLIGCLICCFIPIASYLDFNFLIFLRVLQGIICSAAWPSMHHMSGQWIPANERSSFVSSYLGSSMGVAIYYPIFGWIMKTYSWEYIFHFCGVVGVIWFLCWNYFVYDTPADHPRIDPIERNYIHEKLGSSLQLKDSGMKRKIPWSKMLTSRALWVNTIAQFGGVWGLFTLLTQAPSYFRFVHGWDSTKVGIFSGLPHLLRSIMALIISQVADYCLRNEKMSRDHVRKTGTTIACIVNGVFVIGLAYSGCNATLACVFIILATGFHGAVSAGPLAAIIDNSPNYAGVMLGLVNMFCVIPGFISPIIVSYLTFENQNTESWRLVFLICAFMLIASGVVYLLFSDSSRQDWNKAEPKPLNGDDQEMLNPKSLETKSVENFIQK